MSVKVLPTCIVIFMIDIFSDAVFVIYLLYNVLLKVFKKKKNFVNEALRSFCCYCKNYDLLNPKRINRNL